MARLPRLSIPGLPHHVIQRGNDRQTIFHDGADYGLMLGLLAENARGFGVALHAYVFMTNHFHLLATPTTADGISRLMQAVGRRYVRHFNQRYGRSGTLWEGRYRSTLLEADRYLLPCMAYMDLNPARAGLVANPVDYAWSSHAHYVGARTDSLLSPHPLYWALGNTPFAREVAYSQLVADGVSPELQQALTHSVLSGWPLGSPDYMTDLKLRAGRRVEKAKAGRPRRSPQMS